MHDQTAIEQATPNLMFGERSEIDYLCDSFGVSRSTACNLVHAYSGDRHKMEEEAKRLAIYERLYRRRERG